MLLYHGSYVEIKMPDLNFGRYNLDFDKGFYVTGYKEQAEKWAHRRKAMRRVMQNEESSEPIVSVYEMDFDSTDLNILSFDGYSEAWLDFVVGNRGLAETPKIMEYDVIFGNVANDDVAAVVDDYMRLLEKGRIDSDGKRFFIKQLQFSKPNDQYCIATTKALSLLNFIESYSLED